MSETDMAWSQFSVPDPNVVDIFGLKTSARTGTGQLCQIRAGRCVDGLIPIGRVVASSSAGHVGHRYKPCQGDDNARD